MRAMSLDLAKMSHDYFEAVFVAASTPATVARASWEIGQSAGIRGVHRPAPDGQAYASVSGANAAIIFVGRKSDKTLLGVGNLTHVDGALGNLILPTTQSVIFTVTPVTTNMSFATTTPFGYLNTSSFFTAAGQTGASKDTANHANTVVNRTSIGGVEYPLFTFPHTTGTGSYVGNIAATYTFAGGVANTGPTGHAAGVIVASAVTYTKREPRIILGGQFYYPQFALDFNTTLALTDTTGGQVVGSAFVPTTNFTFTTTVRSYGLFSFVFQVPVYAITDAASTNGGPAHTTWYVRPGFGTNLYNIDDGVNAGGCVLIGVGVTALDWIDIYTRGIGLD
jgi:hypothetical protein